MAAKMKTWVQDGLVLQLVFSPNHSIGSYTCRAGRYTFIKLCSFSFLRSHCVIDIGINGICYCALKEFLFPRIRKWLDASLFMIHG